MKKIFRNLSHVQIIAFGFVLLILLGTCLLSLPVAVQEGESVSFTDALFTATSASCVTGLVTVGTGMTWSLFGQGVILVLIQIGGLGFMTVATLFFVLFRKKMGLRQKEVMSESINSSGIGGILKLAKKIVFGTLLFEGVGALVLFLRVFFSYGYSFGKALWFGVFHAVSSFCNAGFDLNGNFSSFTDFHSDWVICLTLMILIVVGGIGFFVWDEISRKGFHFKRYSLHSKIVLFTTCILILVPAVLFFFLEPNASHAGLSASDAILASLFDSVSPRTAGMNITDTASLSSAGYLITIILMFIGASPSSTGGGIKTTTFAILILFTLSSLRKTRFSGIFGRRLRPQIISKAMLIFFTNLSLAIIGLFVICAAEPYLPIRSVLFEVFSAIGTVGLTLGVTRDLETVSKIVIVFLMFCGRVGSISFGTALMEKKSPPPITVPFEDITVG